MGEALTMRLLQESWAEVRAQDLDPASKMKNMSKKRKTTGISPTLRSRLRFLKNEQEV
jgi:hypothetical protein